MGEPLRLVDTSELNGQHRLAINRDQRELVCGEDGRLWARILVDGEEELFPTEVTDWNSAPTANEVLDLEKGILYQEDEF